MPGCREIVRPGEPGEETGLLVPPGDVAALSRAIAALARDPQRRRAMGRAGRRLVEREFAEQRIAAYTLALYETALRERGFARGPGYGWRSPGRPGSAPGWRGGPRA